MTLSSLIARFESLEGAYCLKLQNLKVFYNVPNETVFSIFGVEKDSCILKMEIEDSIETIINIYQPTHLYFTRDKHHYHLPNPTYFFGESFVNSLLSYSFPKSLKFSTFSKVLSAIFLF